MKIEQPAVRFIVDFLVIGISFLGIKCLMVLGYNDEPFDFEAIWRKNWDFVLIFSLSMAVIRFWKRRNQNQNP